MTVRRRIVAGLLLATLLLNGAACRPKTKTTKSDNTDAAVSGAQQDAILDSALYQLQPENLAINSKLEDVIPLLNTWRQNRPATSSVEVPDGFIADETIAKSIAEFQFDLFDGIYIRNAALAKRITATATPDAGDERTRVARLFQFVVRQVALAMPDEKFPARGPYEIILSGRGTGADRAWVFATLLQQLRIDSAILTPAADDGAPATPRLVAAIIDDEAYLFDPQLGLPIPSESPWTDSWRDRPAALSQAIDHADWLQSFAARADQPYAWTPETLKKAVVQPFVEHSALSTRQRDLERVLPSDRSLALSVNLLDDGTEAGLLTRFGKVKGAVIQAGQLHPWSKPLTAYRRVLEPTKADGELYQAMMIPFQLPVAVKQDPKDPDPQPKMSFERQQWRTRVAQLMGQTDEAVTGYLRMRFIEGKGSPVPALQPAYQVAAEDALFWTALGKLDLQDDATAIETLQNYNKKYRYGRWLPAARWLLAEAQARGSNWDAALAAVAGSGTDDPYRPMKLLLSRHWTSKKGKPADDTGK